MTGILTFNFTYLQINSLLKVELSQFELLIKKKLFLNTKKKNGIFVLYNVDGGCVPIGWLEFMGTFSYGVSESL